MRLTELLEGVEVTSVSPELHLEAVEVCDVQADSHRVRTGCVYACIRGRKADGHGFARLAEDCGAAAVLCDHDIGCARQVITPDTRKAYARMCANLYGNCASALTLAAVTGTNGKTSVATIIKRLLEVAGGNAGLLSTIQAEYRAAGGVLRTLPLARTTPDPHDLHRLFADMRENGVAAVAMEASSHALDQERLWGLQFAVGVFTNLTQDHLDYHSDMEDYFQAKKKLFVQSDFAVVNVDDGYGKRLSEELSIPFATCSVRDSSADYFAEEIDCNEDGVRFTLVYGGQRSPVFFGIPGLYSVHNALEAVAACVQLGMPLGTALEGLGRLGPIRGRNELIETGRGFRVLCDYAHTPDGLENILRSTRQYTKGRIVLVFGCGGDRDKTKRPLMGEIAARYADFLVITSDNPRTERPGAIIGDILKGVPKDHKHIAIIERREAIRYALTKAKRGDTVILAGKGHEQYQVLGDKALYFDERRLVEGILRTLEY